MSHSKLKKELSVCDFFCRLIRFFVANDPISGVIPQGNGVNDLLSNDQSIEKVWNKPDDRYDGYDS